MARRCERCILQEKHKYWNELPVDTHHFFKVMCRDFRHFLKIPTKFGCYFREQLPNRVLLKGPSGNEWSVEIKRRGEEFFLEYGWEKFVRDNGLEEADFLSFQWSGSSWFKVLIFDSTGCEREGAYFSSKNKEPCSHTGLIQEKKEEESVEIETSLNEDEEESRQHERERENASSKANWNEIELKVSARSTGEGVQKEKEETSHPLKSDSKVKRTLLSMTEDEREGKVEVIDVSDDEGHIDLKKQQQNGSSKDKWNEINLKINERNKGKGIEIEEEAEDSVYVPRDYEQHTVQEKCKEHESKTECSGKNLLQSHSLKSNGKMKRKEKDMSDDDVQGKKKQRSEPNFHPAAKTNSKLDEKANSGRSGHVEREPRQGDGLSSLPMQKPMTKPGFSSAPSNRRQTTEEEKRRARQSADRHSSSVPSTMIAMRASYCYGGNVGIPTKWAREHLPNRSENIHLRAPPNKKKWAARMWYGRDKWHLNNGWADFVSENKLEEDDVCVFELAQGGLTSPKPIILDVFIYRAVDESFLLK